MHLPNLVPNDHAFSPSEFGTIPGLVQQLGSSDERKVVMLTCSELGFEPDMLSHAIPGELMVIQLAGGVIKPNFSLDSPTPFAEALNCETIQHLIVCGHSGCQVFDLILRDKAEDKQLLLYKMMSGLANRFEQCYRERPEAEHQPILVQESVLQQLANVRKIPSIKRRLDDGSLRLQGWVRDDAKSTIATYDPVSGQFSK